MFQIQNRGRSNTPKLLFTSTHVASSVHAVWVEIADAYRPTELLLPDACGNRSIKPFSSEVASVLLFPFRCVFDNRFSPIPFRRLLPHLRLNFSTCNVHPNLIISTVIVFRNTSATTVMNAFRERVDIMIHKDQRWMERADLLAHARRIDELLDALPEIPGYPDLERSQLIDQLLENQSEARRLAMGRRE